MDRFTRYPDELLRSTTATLRRHNAAMILIVVVVVVVRRHRSSFVVVVRRWSVRQLCQRTARFAFIGLLARSITLSYTVIHCKVGYLTVPATRRFLPLVNLRLNPSGQQPAWRRLTSAD